MFIDLTTNPPPTTPGYPGGLTLLVHDALQKSGTEALGNIGSPLVPQPSLYWNTILNRALNFSYWTIIQGLIQRGFSKGVIDQWDRGVEFQSDLGIWYCLQWVATQTNVKIEQESLTLLDRRPELVGRHRNLTFGVQPVEPVGITIGGVWQWPDTDVGQVVTGPMDELLVLAPWDERVTATDWQDQVSFDSLSEGFGTWPP